MSLASHTIKKRKGVKRRRVRVGRGNATGKGTYATRGLKGQRSRSGGRSGLKLRGFKQTLLRVPKKRGFKSGKIKPAIVKLADLQSIFKQGDAVTPQKLVRRKLIETARNGVKIVGTGEIKKKLVISGCKVTSGAIEKIKNAGGTVS